MKLSRIRIEQFKQFRQPVEITDLAPGINVFTGPNESGKTTIASAIRTVFLERHRSSSVDDCRPWGDSVASPTVELAFSFKGQNYRLSKSFLGKKRCELQVGAQLFNSAEAEEHLATLLGFQYAEKGGSQDRHWGIPGLLWIQQGSAQEIKTSVTYATGHLRSVLDASLGELASSGGDEVLAAVEAERNELLTRAQGSPRGDYKEALEKACALEQQLAELKAGIDTYRQQVDHLATLRQEQLQDEAEKPWIVLRQQQHSAAQQLEVTREVERKCETEKQRATQLEASITLLRQQLDMFELEEQSLKTRRHICAEAELAHHAAQARLKPCWQHHAQCVREDELARRVLQQARQQENHRLFAARLQECKLKVDSITRTLEQAEQQQLTLRALNGQAAAAAIGSEQLETLRMQHQALHDLTTRQQTVATRLRFTLDDGCSLSVGKETLSGAGERLLFDATALTLPGLGTLEIAPGGKDLAELRREETVLIAQHEHLLQQLGLASLDDAELRQQTGVRLQAEIQVATATLRALAPDGIEVLHAELGAFKTRVAETEQMPGFQAASADLATAAPAAPTISIVEAEAAETAARHALEQANTELSSAQTYSANKQAAFEAATRELAAAQSGIEAPDRAARIAIARQNLTDALAEQSSLVSHVEALSRQVAQAQPELLAQDVERLGQSAAQSEQRFSERKSNLARLEGKLEETGALGLEERHSILAQEFAHAQRRVAELRAHANALDLLLRLLCEKRQTLIQQLQAPLQQYLEHYLQLLFPHASMELDENLAPGALLRPTATQQMTSAAFDALSFGAREQIGIISRLAYADLLKEAGRPTLLMLDDALVHSDSVRLAQMKRILFDAATRHQVLLFTCHPESWQDIGASPRSLEALRATP